MSYVQETENVKDQEPEKEMENAPVILVILVKLALSVPKDITIHMKMETKHFVQNVTLHVKDHALELDQSRALLAKKAT